jgi:hypothetical protein
VYVAVPRLQKKIVKNADKARMEPAWNLDVDEIFIFLRE